MRRREGKDLLRESRRLLKRAAKLGEGPRAAVETATAELDKALRAGSFADQARSLDALLAEHLGAHRKSKSREYFESVGVAILVALVLRSFVIEAFQIPTGSMEPTLLVGDHLFVAKYSYGVRVPFTTRYLFQWRQVERGDIVVFLFPVEEVSTQHTIGEVMQRLDSYHARNHGFPATLDLAGVSETGALDGWQRPFRYQLVEGDYELVSAGPDAEFGTPDDLSNSNSAFVQGVGTCLDRSSLTERKDYIKRVVGLPGDRLSMRDNVLYVNDQALVRSEIVRSNARVHGRQVEQALEENPEGLAYRTWNLGLSPDFDEITVREGHVFVMGDNRDNSSDGRCWGQVPIENVKGRSMFIFYSRDRTPVQRGGSGNYFSSIRWSRFLDGVR